MPEALSLVERGWRGARECSLMLRTHGITVTHLIKGSLPAEVLAMIQPYSFIRLIDVPRTAFYLRLWPLLVWGTLRGRLRWVLLDNERTLQVVSGWCRWFGLSLVLIRETPDNYELLIDQCVRPVADVFGLTAQPPDAG